MQFSNGYPGKRPVNSRAVVSITNANAIKDLPDERDRAAKLQLDL